MENLLKDLTEDQIKEQAKLYKKLKGETANSFGACTCDMIRGDFSGRNAKIRKAAHDHIANIIISDLESKASKLEAIGSKLSNGAGPEYIDSAIAAIDDIIATVNSVDRVDYDSEFIARLDIVAKSMTEAKLTIKNIVNMVVINEASTSKAAASTKGGFDITPFIKTDSITQPPVQYQVQQPPVQYQVQQPPVQQQLNQFPHKTCGLPDEQIEAEVYKHFRITENLNSYPLYDLLNNGNLKRKMKELNAKQRPNNPYLTQVPITKYIADPEQLAIYNKCFTIPCNEKGKIILVLFNPAMVNKNGIIDYPLNIIKTDIK